MLEGFRIEIEYRNRKTLGIKLEGSGSIRVLAPKGTSQRIIKEALITKEKWILNKQRELEGQERPSPIEFGASIPLLGIDRVIMPLDSDESRIIKASTSMEAILVGNRDWSREKLLSSMVDFYRERTRELALERIDIHWRSIGRRPEGITIRNQKTRWASCSSRGSLSFNLRCSMLPIELFDYIVIHELCHLEYMDHSREFWRLMEEILPDYDSKRKRLKSEGATIFRYFRGDDRGRN